MQKEIAKLHRFTVISRWLFVLGCWLTFGLAGIWGLRENINLWLDYFTWSAVRYALAFHPIAAFCLAFPIAMTVSVLVWQSRNILLGLSSREKYLLEEKVKQIKATGRSHPLWRWIE